MLPTSEFTRFVGVTGHRHQVKETHAVPGFVPHLAVLDPESTVDTPRQVWTSTGIRAIGHAVDALCSTNAQPITDAQRTSALRPLVEHLPATTCEPSNLSAAGQCRIAARRSIIGLGKVGIGIGLQLPARRRRARNPAVRRVASRTGIQLGAGSRTTATVVEILATVLDQSSRPWRRTGRFPDSRA
jgi:hypothetical protein